VDQTLPRDVQKFVSWLALHPKIKDAGIKALVLNAGLAFKGDTFGAEEARATLAVNLTGTAAMARALLPLVQKSSSVDDTGSTIVFMASRAGKLSQVAPALQARFSDPTATLESIEALCGEFVAAIEAGEVQSRGWPQSMYGVSKLAELAYARVLERELDTLNSNNIAVNSCCPGWCSTPMSSFKGPRTPAQGAETPVWLCTRKGQGHSRTGGFWAEMREISW